KAAQQGPKKRKDHSEVLKILKKNARKRRGGNGGNRSCEMIHQVSFEDTTSSASVNNDWQNWVVKQGTDRVAVDDV
ncbi:hypothetical protein A2U01_0031390, partial [Trifolium medium]|nr:hypothetical protein [Trifolium medium]